MWNCSLLWCVFFLVFSGFACCSFQVEFGSTRQSDDYYFTKRRAIITCDWRNVVFIARRYYIIIYMFENTYSLLYRGRINLVRPLCASFGHFFYLRSDIALKTEKKIQYFCCCLYFVNVHIYLSFFLLCGWHSSSGDGNAIQSLRRQMNYEWRQNVADFIVHMKNVEPNVRLEIFNVLELLIASYFFFFNRSYHLLFIFSLSCLVCHISFTHRYLSEMCTIPAYAQEFQPLTTMLALKENWENSKTEHDNRCERFREQINQ